MPHTSVSRRSLNIRFVLRAATFVLAIVFFVPLAAQESDHIEHRFGDAEQWAPIFENPERDAWQKPDAVIRALALPPDAVIADIGSGTGYFAVRLAGAVARGRVFGIDVEPDMVRYLNARAQREGLSNLSSHLGATDDPRVPEPVDLALLVAVYHHIPGRQEYFRKLRAALKSGGRLAIIESRIPREQALEELAEAGFELVEEHGFLPRQYFLVLRPAGR